MSSSAGPPEKGAFWSCLSCRVLSGAALIGSGLYVSQGPRRLLRQGVAPGMGHVAQMSLAVGLICWGIVVIADPVGNQKKKGE